MKKLNINEDACIGCGACVAVDGVHFDFNEDGLSEVISNENIDTEECKNAIASCPTNAISYIEQEESCHCKNCEDEHCECKEKECHCETKCNGQHCDCE